MNNFRQSHIIVIVFGCITIASMCHNLVSMRRMISSAEEFYTGNNSSIITNNPYMSSSTLDYMRDEQLEWRYSTTHQKTRGEFSLILNDNDETHTGNNDFQHKGILRKSTEKQGKWKAIRHARPDTTFVVAGETVRKAGTNYSKFVDDMRFVIETNQTIIYRSLASNIDSTSHNDGNFGDNNHLCSVLRQMTGQKSLDTVPKRGIPPITLDIAADCNAMNEQMKGQGSTVLALYGVRMITALAKVDFEFHCSNSYDGDNNTTKNLNNFMKEKDRKLRWVFPWFASYQSATDSNEPWPFLGNAPTQDQVCSSSNINADYTSNKMPLEKMADLMRNDVRKMALQLIGSRTDVPKRVHPLIPLDVEPWIPDISVDDVIIHLPCHNDAHGRGLNSMRRIDRVGILQFREYTKYINEDVKSIGIITDSQGEVEESSNQDIYGECYGASNLLSEYLQEFYSGQSVNISLYNNDTFPLQYARIAMAKQSFSSFSTFGMVPIIGSFGEGYFQPSVSITEGNDYIENKIIRRIISGKYKGFENIRLMSGNVLSPKNISTMKLNEIAEWLSASS